MPLVLNRINLNSSDLDSLLLGILNNKDGFDQVTAKHSAVLLRGFDLKTAADFNDVVETYGWEDIRYVGPSPRTHIHKRVYTANEVPLSEFIYYHHEMVLMKFPKKVVPCCEVPPPGGGETPLVPSFKVTEKMVKEFPKAVADLEEKGSRYTFTALSRRDKSSMRGSGWEDAFLTSDWSEAEKRAKAMGMDIEWLENRAARRILAQGSNKGV